MKVRTYQETKHSSSIRTLECRVMDGSSLKAILRITGINNPHFEALNYGLTFPEMSYEINVFLNRFARYLSGVSVDDLEQELRF